MTPDADNSPVIDYHCPTWCRKGGRDRDPDGEPHRIGKDVRLHGNRCTVTHMSKAIAWSGPADALDPERWTVLSRDDVDEELPSRADIMISDSKDTIILDVTADDVRRLADALLTLADKLEAG